MMYQLIITLCGLGLLTCGTVWTGHCILCLLNLRCFRYRTPETICLSAFVGTASWAVVTSWLSYSGFTVRACALVLLLLLVALGATVLFVRRRAEWRLLTCSRAVVMLALPVALAVLLSLYPLLRFGWFHPKSDAITYIVSSEWLQDHSYHDPCPRDLHQIGGEFAIFQQIGLRMGANYLFALTQACSIMGRAIDIYLAMVTFGVILNLAGVYLATRWCLRLSQFYGLLAVTLIAALANPLYFAARTGFMHQLYGTAFLCCSLAVLARALPPANHSWRMALLVGLLHSAQALYYSEMLPFLLAADLAFAAIAIRSAVRAGRLLAVARYGLLIAAAFVIFSNYELARVATAARALSNAVVGWPIPHDPSRLLAFSLGAGEFSALSEGDLRQKLVGVPWYVALLLMGLVLLGARQAARRTLAAGVVCAAGMFLVLFLYYAFRAYDPQTGLVGHRWNMFKICKYAYPLVVLLQVQGVWFLCRERRIARPVILALVGWLAVHQFPQHKQTMDGDAIVFSTLMGSPNPFREMRALRKLVDREPAAHIVLGSTIPYRATMLAYAIYPRPIVNTWCGDKGRAWWVAPSLLDSMPPGPCLLVDPPIRTSDLPWGASWIDRRELSILRLHAPNGLESLGGEPALWVGTEPVWLDVFAPESGEAVFTFRSAPGPTAPTITKRLVRVFQPDGSTYEQMIDVSDRANPQFTVSLPAGVSRVKMQCLERPTAHPPAGANQIMLFAIINPTLQAAALDTRTR